MKLVIVGGVAGGASAAARARRLDEQAEILLLQSGPDVSYASCGMPYYIGGEITNRAGMSVQTPQTLHDRLNITVCTCARVTKIHTEKQVIDVLNEQTGESVSESYDQLILAVGAVPFKPPISGIDRPGLFVLRNLDDMDEIFHWIQNQSAKSPNHNMHCVVAGAGFVGLEMVEQLLHRGNIQVTLVEMMKQILSPLDEEMAAILHQDLEAHGVTVIVNDGIQEFLPDPTDPDVSSILRLSSGRILPSAQMTILGLGVRPDTSMIQESGIECTPRGHIVVNEYLQTSVANVWAVGDAIEVTNPILPASDHAKWAIPLAGPANRQGRMVADNIFLKSRKKYTGTFGVSIMRCFDLYAACVGMNAKMLSSQSIPFQAVHIHPSSHAGYYPGASPIHLKLLFCPTSGKIYGAQAVGKDGVDKRIDVIATAMQGSMTVHDLSELELSYAPPVGSAKDPVNYAGMVASNIVDGLVSSIGWSEFQDQLMYPEHSLFVLDVRNPEEIAKTGPIAPNAINIPLNELRRRIDEIPRENGRRIVVSCMSGQRAYYACRILLQQGGFSPQSIAYLSGSYLTLNAAMHQSK